MSIHRSLIGAAGVYHVVSELSRRALIALPTIRNTKGYDIIVASADGHRHANLDVKTSQRRVEFWPMPCSSTVCAGPNDYYVLLRWIEKEKRYEGFMLTGAEAKQEILESERDASNEKRRREGKAPFCYVSVGKYAYGKDLGWKQRWDTWTL